jgi:hypothetical protein
VELDLRGTVQQVLKRLAKSAPIAADATETPEKPAGPGRPKLGVVFREIGLLPRHWDWLALQPGGASVTLRKLVEDAKKKSTPQDEIRRAQNATHKFMSAMAGDLPGFEEALRALYAPDRARFNAQVSAWPKDVRDHAKRLSDGAFGG